MSASVPPDRIALLRQSLTMNGIDFVEVDPSQTLLVVHFVNGVAPSRHDPTIRITGGDVIPEVRVLPFGAPSWGVHADGHRYLRIHTASPGDFSNYTLTIENLSNLDRFFRSARFSFKANCPSTIDCKPADPYCPGDEGEDPQIDYLAKDFLSFKQALLDFSSRRYPLWVERSEADLGVVLIELMSAVADDLSYTQDRIAAQAYLDTATERRSLIRHARLVDYEPRPATVAHVWLRLTISANLPVQVPAGLPVFARAPDGQRIPMETGTGLFDKATYPGDKRWNGLTPYMWDKSETCLPDGSTEMWLEGKNLGLKEVLDAKQDLWLLLDTESDAAGGAPVRQAVRVTKVEEDQDILQNKDVTHIIWGHEDALKQHHNLLRTIVYGNLVPATQGRRASDVFAVAIESVPPADKKAAVVRTGPNGTPMVLFTLRDGPLAWIAKDGKSENAPHPEIRVVQKNPTNEHTYRKTLLSSGPFDEVFTVEPVKYTYVGPEIPGARKHEDYDGDLGWSVRFGDGVFGSLPRDGAIFEVSYRVGGGEVGNVAPDSITGIEPGSPLLAYASAVVNPFAARGGAEQETAENVRRDAPEAFKENLRAVRKEDYENVAASLSWVERAGTTFRYTGSYRTIFTAADALETRDQAAAGVPSPVQLRELTDLLNRRRMAGYESYVLAPRFVALDLDIEVCAKPDAFKGHVEDALAKALSARRFADGTLGFFHVDHFTFGTPLLRSALEAAIMAVFGVDGVRFIKYRRRGKQGWSPNTWDAVRVSANEILRVDTNLNRPERGSVHINVEGGK